MPSKNFDNKCNTQIQNIVNKSKTSIQIFSKNISSKLNNNNNNNSNNNSKSNNKNIFNSQ